ncbi:MurR/RpiR family transcriptional regulator [Caldibacillus thermoamylovorans]
MELTLLEKVKNNLESVARTEREIAMAILENQEIIQSLTIKDLSKIANVSEASVVRFYKRLGISSFKTFQIELIKEVNSLTNINDFSLLKYNDTPYQLLQKVISNNEYSLYSLRKTINKKDFEKAVEILINSNRIGLYGVGGSSTAAYDANNKFIKIGYSTGMYTDFHTMLAYVSNLNKNDVLILFSTSGKTKEIIEIASFAKKLEIPTIAITADAKSQLIKLSDISLLYPDIEQDHRLGSITSRIMQLIIVDSLYLNVFRKIEPNIIKNYQNSREVILNIRR